MSLLDDIRGAARNAYCEAFQTYGEIARFGAGLLYGDRAGGIFPNSGPGMLGNIATSIFCDRPILDPPALPTGGQCPDNYCLYVQVIGTVSGTGSAFNTGPNINNSGLCGYPGPVSAPYIAAGPGGGPFVFVTTGTGEAVPLNNVSGINVEQLIPDHYRQNGLPDNCTGPPPDYEPLPEPDRTAPINIDNRGGTIVFGNPQIDLTGNFLVPVNIVAGNIFLTGALVLNKGEINLNFGGLPTTPDSPLIPTPDQPPPDGEEGDEEDGPANIIGAIVVAEEIGNIRATQVRQDEAPDIYAPKVGHISFKIPIKDTFHWTSDISIKNKNNFIHNPTLINAVKVRATPEAGFNLTVIPVRGIVPGLDVVLI